MNTIITQVIDCVLQGKVACVPTETVYGLVADATNYAAIQKIYELKKRDEKQPLAIFVKNIDMAKKVADINEYAEKIMQSFMPGPITVIVNLTNPTIIKDNVYNKLDNSIGIRIPDHKLVLDILNKIDRPIVATSANPSGQSPATSYQAAKEYFSGKVELILDGGECQHKLASTVVDCRNSELKILRVGSIGQDEICGCVLKLKF